MGLCYVCRKVDKGTCMVAMMLSRFMWDGFSTYIAKHHGLVMDEEYK